MTANACEAFNKSYLSFVTNICARYHDPNDSRFNKRLKRILEGYIQSGSSQSTAAFDSFYSFVYPQVEEVGTTKRCVRIRNRDATLILNREINILNWFNFDRIYPNLNEEDRINTFDHLYNWMLLTLPKKAVKEKLSNALDSRLFDIRRSIEGKNLTRPEVSKLIGQQVLGDKELVRELLRMGLKPLCKSGKEAGGEEEEKEMNMDTIKEMMEVMGMDFDKMEKDFEALADQVENGAEGGEEGEEGGGGALMAELEERFSLAGLDGEEEEEADEKETETEKTTATITTETWDKIAADMDSFFKKKANSDILEPQSLQSSAH